MISLKAQLIAQFLLYFAVLKVSKADERRERYFGQYKIYHLAGKTDARVKVEPQLHSYYSRHITGCVLEVTRKADGRRIHSGLRAPFVGRKFCNFDVRRLSANTEYKVRVRLTISRRFSAMRKFERSSLYYYGLRTMEDGTVKPTPKPTPKPTRKPTTKALQTTTGMF